MNGLRETARNNAMQDAAQNYVTKKCITGLFEEAVNVNGFDITIRGNVVDGIVKIGTAFMP